jgi:beta-glucosidase
MHGAYSNPGTTDFATSDEGIFAGAQLVTVKAALQAELAAHGIAMSYAKGADAVDNDGSGVAAAARAAREADVAVLVVGDLDHRTCGETTDRSDLDLAGGQLPLMRALAATATPLVVLLLNGRAATFGRG